jgi:predicted DNA-binding transcriptional regulator YafY
LTDRINSSLTTLALLLGESAARSVSGMSIGFHGKGFIDYSPHLGTIAILNKAIEKRSICNVIYRPGGRRAEATYRYAPGRILAMGGTLYVQGHRLAEHSVMTERPTTFSLHRISQVTPIAEYFRFDAADGDACAFGLNWHEPRRMQIRVAASAGDYVRDRVWSDDQVIEDTEDGGLLLSVTTTSEKELRAWVYSFGGAAQLVGGQEMAETGLAQ